MSHKITGLSGNICSSTSLYFLFKDQSLEKKWSKQTHTHNLHPTPKKNLQPNQKKKKEKKKYPKQKKPYSLIGYLTFPAFFFLLVLKGKS